MFFRRQGCLGGAATDGEVVHQGVLLEVYRELEKKKDYYGVANEDEELHGRLMLLFTIRRYDLDISSFSLTASPGIAVKLHHDELSKGVKEEDRSSHGHCFLKHNKFA
ncbi:hypothetical protein VNO78_33761 [Psophocarpus tetragonolobus]|uniref:Uncharacterized protein n=1 Tax=Psophocarpus tetragonolobus TaxID=3891 RepID=A0AAN9RLM3_PSOTE